MLPYFSSVFRYNIILWLCYLTDYGRRVRIFAPIEHTKVAYPQYYVHVPRGTYFEAVYRARYRRADLILRYQYTFLRLKNVCSTWSI